MNSNCLVIKLPRDSYFCRQNGDSDVGDIVVLMTLWWWLISAVGGRIIMLATFFGICKHISVISATKIFAPFCPFLRYFPYRKKCSKMTEILLRYWQISQKKDKKPKIFVALMNDIATRRDCDIIATLSVATKSQPCGSRYIDNVKKSSVSFLINKNSHENYEI